MKVLITGGGGFIGSRLAKELLARGELAGKRLTQLTLLTSEPASGAGEADVLPALVQAAARRLCETAR